MSKDLSDHSEGQSQSRAAEIIGQLKQLQVLHPMARHVTVDWAWLGQVAGALEALDAECTRLRGIERKYRELLWLGHGHQGLYGDDGEMQCSQCAPVWDYKRAPLEQVEAAANQAKMQRVAEALKAAGERLRLGVRVSDGEASGGPCARPEGGLEDAQFEQSPALAPNVYFCATVKSSGPSPYRPSRWRRPAMKETSIAQAEAQCTRLREALAGLLDCYEAGDPNEFGYFVDAGRKALAEAATAAPPSAMKEQTMGEIRDYEITYIPLHGEFRVYKIVIRAYTAADALVQFGVEQGDCRVSEIRPISVAPPSGVQDQGHSVPEHGEDPR